MCPVWHRSFSIPDTIAVQHPKWQCDRDHRRCPGNSAPGELRGCISTSRVPESRIHLAISPAQPLPRFLPSNPPSPLAIRRWPQGRHWTSFAGAAYHRWGRSNGCQYKQDWICFDWGHQVSWYFCSSRLSNLTSACTGEGVVFFFFRFVQFLATYKTSFYQRKINGDYFLFLFLFIV